MVKSTFKKSFFSLAGLVLMCSCSNQQVTLNLSDENSIKNELDRRKNELNWTDETDSMRLQGDIGHYEKVSDAVKLSPQVMSVISASEKAVYPRLEGFGSLDTSRLTAAPRAKIRQLAEFLSTDFYGNPSAFFKMQYAFNFVFFRNDFVTLWTQTFGDEFSTEERYKAFVSTLAEGGQLFSVLAGEPFSGGEYIEIPVRLLCKYGHIDVIIYMENSVSPLIYQIDIIGQEKNGK